MTGNYTWGVDAVVQPAALDSRRYGAAIDSQTKEN
jgi:hypothetical protein